MSGNKVKVTLTTIRDAEGRITGTSSSRSIFVPAEMSPPDLTPLTNGDEEYILVRVSKEKGKCWVTYLNGQDPDTDREFAINTTVKALLDQEHSDIDLPMPTPPFVKMDRGQLKEMIDKRKCEMIVTKTLSSQDGSHARFRNRSESEPGEERPPRKLRESCKTQSPASPEKNPSPLEPRTQWMIEDDPRTEEEADAEWRRVTESLFGTNTRTEPMSVGESWGRKDEKTFTPTWGNLPVTQELKGEEKRWAEVWKQKSLDSDRRERDKQRESGGSPVRGNRSAKTTLLDEIEDPHGDYARAGAAGYDKEPAYPWTKEDVIKYENEVKGGKSQNEYPKQGSPSSDPRQELSCSSPPAGTNKGKRGENASKPRKVGRKRDLEKTDEPEDRKDLSNRKKRSVKKKGKTTLVVKISLANSLHDLDLVGIDTCSAVSVSTEKEDFIFIDGSREARDSVSLRGVGGSSSVIGGRGPMVVKTKDREGNEVLVFDPSAVYLDPDELKESQARFRIFGQAKLRRAGLKMVQDKYGNDEDYLVYRQGEMEIPMEINDDIVTMRTMPLDLTREQDENLGTYIEDVLVSNKEEQAFMKVVDCNSFIMNEANLSQEERASVRILV
jgi:hypothetical protein